MPTFPWSESADGLSIRFLPVNLAFAIMWGSNHILRIVNTRQEAESIVAEMRSAR